MNLILSETFLSLPKEKQQALMETYVGFYYPEDQEAVMADKEWRKDVVETLAKLENMA